MDTLSQQRPHAPESLSQNQPLPSIASLTSGAPPPLPEQSPIRLRQHSEARDSGNWSISQSKHSSGVSNTMGCNIQAILNTEESPSRNSVPDTPSSARHPSYQGNALPTLNHGFDNRLSIESSLHDSRRSSVDSRFASNMNHLAISPSSPYDSQNASRVSLVSNLQQQRGITRAEDRPIGASPLSPLSRTTPRTSHQPRQAPVINPNPRGVAGMPDPTASNPTKGFAWAFPDEPDERRGSSSGESSVAHSMSRQNSYAASINSSIYTTDSTMPNGQKRFGEDDMGTTHHHSMQHRAVSNLQSADHAGTPGSGNYSRTPELRYGHKMAERKRRSEMKLLFDELNSILPNSPGSKSSKWEILTKSIEHIKQLRASYDASRSELMRMRPEAEFSRRLQEENQMLRNELNTVWQQLRQVDPNNLHVHGNMTRQFAQDAAQPQAPPPASSNTLPPIQQQQQQPPLHHHAQPTQWGAPPPSAMQGVEFAGMRPYEHPHR